MWLKKYCIIFTDTASVIFTWQYDILLVGLYQTYICFFQQKERLGHLSSSTVLYYNAQILPFQYTCGYSVLDISLDHEVISMYMYINAAHAGKLVFFDYIDKTYSYP